MAAVTHLLTICDLNLDHTDPRPLSGSVSAEHLAVLDDGRQVVLLDDRGWSGSQLAFWRYAEPSEPPLRLSLEQRVIEALDDVESTARTVVGPDAPWGSCTEEEMAQGHWRTLAQRLGRAGIEIDPETLRALPHEVALTDALRSRVTADVRALHEQERRQLGRPDSGPNGTPD